MEETIDEACLGGKQWLG